MLKKISSLQATKPLSKEQQKDVLGGRAYLSNVDTYIVYCRCDDGSEWTVGSSSSESRVRSMIAECQSDGGTPYMHVI